MGETTLVEFRDERGRLTVINPALVASIQDDVFPSPGGYYQPGCTVVLAGGEKIRLSQSASSVLLKFRGLVAPPQ